ncbi:MAG TPA: polyprenyl synthetase family protein [Polyangiaceae bacterium]|nr:polyprenyl synthetase family protein [Polyangiaceae bacterium]
MPLGPKSSRRHRRQRKGQAKAIAPNPFLSLLGAIKLDMDDKLERFFADELVRVKAHGAEIRALLRATAALSSRGGKRLRPTLLVAGFRVVSPSGDLEPALDAGLALELLHTYLLVHDDWMDGDALRRGGPTVHAALREHFDDERLGEVTAILAGDFAAALATEVIGRVRAPAARQPAVLAAFAEMQKSAIIGQVLDVAAKKHDPETMYALKTGSYTVRGPLRLGALLAGAKDSTLKALDAYAAPVGIAFQLADDLLSAFGNPSITGKALGNDLRAGKRTPLVLEGFKRARGADRKLLTATFGNARASEAQVKRALDVLERSGARKKTEDRIEELLAEGLGSLRKGISSQARELLEGAALALTARRV